MKQSLAVYLNRFDSPSKKLGWQSSHRVFGHLEPGQSTKFPRCIRVYFLSSAIVKIVFYKNKINIPQCYNWTLYILNFDCQKRLLNRQERLKIKFWWKKSEFFTSTSFNFITQSEIAVFLVRIFPMFYALQWVQNTTLNLPWLVRYSCFHRIG